MLRSLVGSEMCIRDRPDIFIDQDSPEKMYKVAGLDNLSILNKVEETLNSNIILAKIKIKFPNQPHCALFIK